jgi:hypothetical protein
MVQLSEWLTSMVSFLDTYSANKAHWLYPRCQVLRQCKGMGISLSMA